MKHFVIDFDFIGDQVKNGDLRVTYMSFKYQLVDIFTKLFLALVSLISRSRLGFSLDLHHKEP